MEPQIIWASLVFLLITKYTIAYRVDDNCEINPGNVRINESVVGAPFPASNHLDFFIKTKELTRIKLYAPNYGKPTFTIDIYVYNFSIRNMQDERIGDSVFDDKSKGYKGFRITYDKEYHSVNVRLLRNDALVSAAKDPRKSTILNVREGMTDDNDPWNLRTFTFHPNSYGAWIADLPDIPTLRRFRSKKNATWCPIVSSDPKFVGLTGEPGEECLISKDSQDHRMPRMILSESSGVKFIDITDSNRLPLTTFMYHDSLGSPIVPCRGEYNGHAFLGVLTVNKCRGDIRNKKKLQPAEVETDIKVLIHP